jgi:hypothetical protein
MLFLAQVAVVAILVSTRALGWARCTFDNIFERATGSWFELGVVEGAAEGQAVAGELEGVAGSTLTEAFVVEVPVCFRGNCKGEVEAVVVFVDGDEAGDGFGGQLEGRRAFGS